MEYRDPYKPKEYLVIEETAGTGAVFQSRSTVVAKHIHEALQKVVETTHPHGVHTVSLRIEFIKELPDAG